MIALEFFEEHGLAGAADTVDQQAGHADSSSHGVQLLRRNSPASPMGYPIHRSRSMAASADFGIGRRNTEDRPLGFAAVTIPLPCTGSQDDCSRRRILTLPALITC